MKPVQLRKHVEYHVMLNKPDSPERSEALAVGKGSSIRVAAMRAVEKLINAKTPLPAIVVISANKVTT